MLDALRQRTVATVLFDEHHGEAWSIRPEAAARMRPSHPAAASYAHAAAQLAERDFEVTTTTGRPLDDARLAGVDVLVVAHPSEGKWERTVGDDSPRVLPRRDRRRTGLRGPRRRPRRARRGGRGQVRRQPQRAPGSLWRACRVCHGVRLPGRRRRADLDPRGAGRRCCRPRHPVPRPRRGVLPRRRGGGGCAGSAGVAHERHGGPARRGPGRGRALRRRPRGGRRGLGPLRRRLPAAARPPAALAEPRVLGVAARVPGGRDAHRLGGGAGSRVGPPQGGHERPPPPPGAHRRRRPRSARHRRGAGARGGDGRGHRRPRAAVPAPEGVPDAGGGRPGRLGRGRLRQARLPGVARPLPAGPRTPGRRGAPRGLPALHAQRLSRHALRGAHHAHAVAGLHRPHRARALRQRQVRPGPAGRQHGRLRQRVRGAVPRDGERRGAADQPLRRHLLRPRVHAGTAAPRCARRRCCASTCRRTRERSRPRRTSRSRRTSSGT